MPCGGTVKRLVAISPSLQPTTSRQSAASISVVGDAVVAAEQAGAERIGAGDRALAGHRVRDRNAEGARESACSASAAPRDVDAAAGEHERALGLGEQRRGARGRGAVRAAAQRGRRLVALRRPRNPRPRTACVAVADVLRHVDARPAPAGPRSRPRRRGASARGCARRARCGSAPCTAGLRISVWRAFLGHVLPGMQRGWRRRRSRPSACRR